MAARQRRPPRGEAVSRLCSPRAGIGQAALPDCPIDALLIVLDRPKDCRRGADSLSSISNLLFLFTYIKSLNFWRCS